MPARSNLFQRLVAEIHRDLGPEWTVTESHFLTDSSTGELREVDVVAESVVGGYPLIISVEVRDRSRVADVTWLEGIGQKHQHLGTNKLVAWSSSGFSAAARKKAKALGMELAWTTSMPTWAKTAQQLIDASVKLVRPHFEVSADVFLNDGTAVRWPAPPTMLLQEAHGDRVAPVSAILHQMTSSTKIRTVMLDHAPEEGAADFHAIYTPPFPCIITGPDNVIGTLKRLVFGITTKSDLVSLKAKSALHRGIVTTLAEGVLPGGTLRFVVREFESSPASTVATLAPVKPAVGS